VIKEIDIDLRKEIGARIRALRDQLGLKQPDLARLCGWDGQSRISNYENGIRMPELTDFIKLAKALKTTPQYLQFGDSEENKVNIHSISNSNITEFLPIIKWTDLEKWSEDEMLKEVEKQQESKNTPKYPNYMNIKDGFILEVKNNAMQSNDRLSFVEGEYIIVSPHTPYRDKSLVIAKINNQVEFLQYIIYAGKAYLKALNPTYPEPIPVHNKIKIIGVVVGSFKHNYVLEEFL
jgi:SOS-response transcriptional repressor LexA